MDMGNRNIKVNLADICAVMGDQYFGCDHYLDLETGKVLLMPEFGTDDEETEQIREAIEQSDDRYREIPKYEPSSYNQDMEDFIAKVEDSGIAESLRLAVASKSLSRRFKYVLAHNRELAEKWFDFVYERRVERALDWLKKLGISPSMD